MSVSAATQEIKIYGYRWVVLLTYMFISLTMQIFWICYAPITGIAAVQYGVSDMDIALLAMLFMFIYIPLAIPASWAIDTWGFKKAVGLAAILMGIFGMVRGIWTDSYTAALIATVGIAIAQPLILNSGTKLAANWFPLGERATVIGLGAIAPFLGIVIGQMATPALVESSGISTTMLIYGILGAISAILFLLFARDHPPTPAGHEERVVMWEGFKHVLKMRDFWMLAFILFVVNAIFNGLLTYVEMMVRPRGMDAGQAGTIGGALMLGGILGVFVLPLLSDRLRKRKPVFMIGLIAMIPFLFLFPFINNYILLILDAFLLGLFMMGLLPVALQYGTEICYPAPEGTSGGLMTLAGQLSVIAITGMGLSAQATGSFSTSMLVLVVVTAISAVVLYFMKESKMMAEAKN